MTTNCGYTLGKTRGLPIPNGRDSSVSGVHGPFSSESYLVLNFGIKTVSDTFKFVIL